MASDDDDDDDDDDDFVLETLKLFTTLMTILQCLGGLRRLETLIHEWGLWPENRLNAVS